MRKNTLDTWIEKFAKGVARKNANQACIFWTYQEKLPDSVKKKMKK